MSAGRVVVRDVSSNNPNGSAGSLEPGRPLPRQVIKRVRSGRLGTQRTSGDGII